MKTIHIYLKINKQQNLITLKLKIRNKTRYIKFFFTQKPTKTITTPFGHITLNFTSQFFISTFTPYKTKIQTFYPAQPQKPNTFYLINSDGFSF